MLHVIVPSDALSCRPLRGLRSTPVAVANRNNGRGCDESNLHQSPPLSFSTSAYLTALPFSRRTSRRGLPVLSSSVVAVPLPVSGLSPLSILRAPTASLTGLTTSVRGLLTSGFPPLSKSRRDERRLGNAPGGEAWRVHSQGIAGDAGTSAAAVVEAETEAEGREEVGGAEEEKAEKLQYVPLHTHSDFSLLDGASQLKGLVARAKELNMPGIALTDHGVMYGVLQLVRMCEAEGLKPVIGNEMYLVHDQGAPAALLQAARALREQEEQGEQGELREEREESGMGMRMGGAEGEGDGGGGQVVLERVGEVGGAVMGSGSGEGDVGQGVGGEVAEGLAGEEQAGEAEAVGAGKAVKAPPVKRYHLTVLAKDMEGYRNLVQLTSLSHLHGMVGNGARGRPCITRELLAHHRKGLIVLSGCMSGEVPRAIMADSMDEARSTVDWYHSVFGSDYYLEVMDHGRIDFGSGYDVNAKINRALLHLSQETGVPLVATNDSHFTRATDHRAHQTLVSVKAGKNLVQAYTGQEYVKSPEEMLESLQRTLPEEYALESLQNSLRIADKVVSYSSDLFSSKPKLPTFDVPRGHTDASWLESEARRGLQAVMGVQTWEAVPQPYRERLDLELRVICNYGLSAYFLIVADIIQFARRNDIPVGPGRGSAAGSLVAYALEIISIDPIEHGLYFERFLNEERLAPPDIDSDFCPLGRDKILAYIAEKYGAHRVAQIATFNRMGSRAVLKDVGRDMQIPLNIMNELTKLVPVERGKAVSLKTLMAEDTPFRRRVERDAMLLQCVELGQLLEGTNRSFGVHAAGIIISPACFPLSQVVPVQHAPGNPSALVSQYAMDDVERLGLLKFDILGLRNLTTAHLARLLAQRTYGVSLPVIEKLPVENRATFELLSGGDVDGVFQLEASPGMKKVVRALKPSSLADIFAIVALYRPGPLDAGLVDRYINRKHGREPVSFQTPKLEPILKETYGVLLYQEQIMRMARDLAGYSLGQADMLRRAMGKKKQEEMEAHHERFVEGAVERGVERAVAEDLFEQMVKFSQYCFNKSHSAAYGYLTYVTAFLKANYPLPYMAALLSTSMLEPPTLRRYVNSCRAAHINILPPSVNASAYDFSVELLKTGMEGGEEREEGFGQVSPSGPATSAADGGIRFGLAGIRDVSRAAAEEIIGKREAGGRFVSIQDLVDRIDLGMWKRPTIHALAHSGALDCLILGEGGEGGGDRGVEGGGGGSEGVLGEVGEGDGVRGGGREAEGVKGGERGGGGEEVYVDRKGLSELLEGLVKGRKERIKAEIKAVARRERELVMQQRREEKQREKAAKELLRQQERLAREEKKERERVERERKREQQRIEREQKKLLQGKGRGNKVEAAVVLGDVPLGAEAAESSSSTDSSSRIDSLDSDTISSSSSGTSDSSTPTLSSVTPSSLDVPLATNTSADNAISPDDSTTPPPPATAPFPTPPPSTTTVPAFIIPPPPPLPPSVTAALILRRPLQEEEMVERLAQEKALLGFYVTQHPVEALLPSLPTWLSLTPLASCAHVGLTKALEDSVAAAAAARGGGRRGRGGGSGKSGKAGPSVAVVAMVEAVNVRMTKNSNKQMANLQLDDGTGQLEAVVFPDVFARYGSNLSKGATVLAWCTVDVELDDSPAAAGSGDSSSSKEEGSADVSTEQESLSSSAATGAESDAEAQDDISPGHTLPLAPPSLNRLQLVVQAAVPTSTAQFVRIDVTEQEAGDPERVHSLRSTIQRLRRDADNRHEARVLQQDVQKDVEPQVQHWVRQQRASAPGAVPVVFRVWPDTDAMPREIVAKKGSTPYGEWAGEVWGGSGWGGTQAGGESSGGGGGGGREELKGGRGAKKRTLPPHLIQAGDYLFVENAERAAEELGYAGYRARVVPILSHECWEKRLEEGLCGYYNDDRLNSFLSM
ncbi:unnamed protein product [Closterium sp. NIES-54]